GTLFGKYAAPSTGPPANVTAVGAVASRLIWTFCCAAVPPALVAEQEYVTTFWSAVMSWSAQPVLIRECGDSGSVTVQVSDTFPVYQSLSPSGTGGVAWCVMTGAVGSTIE